LKQIFRITYTTKFPLSIFITFISLLFFFINYRSLFVTLLLIYPVVCPKTTPHNHSKNHDNYSYPSNPFPSSKPVPNPCCRSVDLGEAGDLVSELDFFDFDFFEYEERDYRANLFVASPFELKQFEDHPPK